MAQPDFIDEYDPDVIAKDRMEHSITKIAASIEKLSEAKQFDENLNDTVKEALQGALELIQALKPEKVDLGPIAEKMAEISQQNKAILTATMNLLKPDDSRYESMMSKLLAVIERNEKFMQEGMAQIVTMRNIEVVKETDYSQELSNLSTTMEKKRRDSWLFEIRDKFGSVVKTVVANPIINT